MQKECVVLSKSNPLLLFKIGEVCKSHKICFSPSTTIVEMLHKLNNGTNAIIIDDATINFDCETYLEKKMLQKAFYVIDEKIYNYKKELAFDSFEMFFNSKLFELNLKKDKNDNYKTIVNQKIAKLGIVVNSWIDRFIKLTLCEMYQNNTENISKEMLYTIALKCEIEDKYLYDTIRPRLKYYLHKLNEIKGIGLNIKGVKQIFNQLYKYCFN